MTTRSPQQYISEACELELEQHGDTFRGAGYTRSSEEADTVYEVMAGIVREDSEPITMLDLGCGLAHLLDFLRRHDRYGHIEYAGLDLSRSYLEVAAAKHPDIAFYELDLLTSDDGLPEFDYIVMNGLFNYRGEVPYDEMLEYWKRMLTAAFRHCRRGVAFNVMSKIVDWERDDLFHLPFDEMSRFVSADLTRHFQIRHDYGAFEYTTYLYREPFSDGAFRGEHSVRPDACGAEEGSPGDRTSSGASDSS